MPRPVLGRLLLAQAESEPYRRNTRIPLGMPITICGKDKVGSAFEESTETIDVSKKGVKTSTLHQLLANAKIRISNGHVGKAVPARVVWQGPASRPDERAEMGVEFLEPFESGSIWTIGSLPDDWVEGQIPLTASQKLEYFWARSKSLQMLPELEALPRAAEPPSVQMPPVVPTVNQEINAVGFPEEEIMPEVVETHDVEAPPPIEAMTSSLEPTGKIGWIPRPAPQASVKAVEKGLRTMESPKKTPVNPRSAPPPGDSPIAAMNQLAQMLCEQADTISQGVDRAVSSVESAAEESVAKLQNVRQQIENQLGTAHTEHQKRLAAINAKSAEELRQNSEALLDNFQKQLRRQIEDQLETISDEHQKRLAAINARSAEEVRQNSEALLENFRKQLQRQIEDQLEAVSAEHQKRLAALVVSSVQQVRDVAASFKDASTRQLKELKEKNLELQHQNEEYMETCQGSVRQEIAAAKSAVAPRGLIWVLAMLMMATTALFAFAYFSTQPIMRLRPDPPAEFVDPNVNADQRGVEDQLARAYWNSTVRDVQRTYKFHTVLPEQPLAEFEIQPQDAIDVNSKSYLDASRGRYWQRLRTVWDNPRVWEESYEWNPEWIVTRLKSLGLMLRR